MFNTTKKEINLKLTVNINHKKYHPQIVISVYKIIITTNTTI